MRAPRARQLCQRPAVESDRPAADGHDARECAQQAGFAGAVRADERNPLAPPAIAKLTSFTTTRERYATETPSNSTIGAATCGGRDRDGRERYVDHRS